jgi:hypothetical protein
MGQLFHLGPLGAFNPSSLELEFINRIRQGRQKMCPHLAIRGATGSERHIGQDVTCDAEEAIICRTSFQSRCRSVSDACFEYDPSGETMNR